MRVQTNDIKKTAAIWLTHEDQENPYCSALLDSLVSVCKRNGFFPVIFRSGSSDLYDSTEGLLLHNRNNAIRKEVERERSVKN